MSGETLVIEREKWLRGTADGELLRERDGKMCCLGFFGLACGYSRSEIQGLGDPEEAANEREEPSEPALWPNWLLAFRENDYGALRPHDTEVCGDLIKVNDDQHISDSDREAQIATIFAKHGVTVRFV